MDDFALAAPAVISIQERRTAEGLDRHIPIILRDGIPYDADLDRFFLDLPLNGVRSPHSLRAYGYDIAVWVRFLHAACGKMVWAATRVDVDAFHRARRREDAGARISAASWNRGVAALEKLYRWAELEGLVGSSPFTHREVWRRDMAAGGPALLRGTIPTNAPPSDPTSASCPLKITACFVMSDFAASTSTAPSGPAPETATAPATRSSPSCWSRPACASPRRRSCLRPNSPIWRTMRPAAARPGSSCRAR